ncbi:T9SS type A sorting domain-containing protein [Taibaiella helva]|uniref:T9SS type A sorting domain-containing protein n=1 Tax=Taibaiella helva TaxID=2301235 RepID=UPI0021D02332|nr:T9SS type A sorting domain-containing protein [Taibaiella helva]
MNGGESIRMYDATGRMIKEIKAVQASVTIDPEGLNNGAYHIHISGANGTVISRKVAKVN